jgi:hypothetical protein
MFERFTDQARRAVVYAREEARRLEYNYIGTEHLLLGLCREADGLAAQALRSLGVSVDDVRAQVEQVIGRGRSAPIGRFPFNPRAKTVLELALREALQLGHNYLGTEHLLLGLIREGDGFAAQLLVGMGVDLANARGAVMTQLIARGDVDGSQLSPDRVPPSDEPAGLVRVIPLVRVELVPPQTFTLIALDLWTSFIEFRYVLQLGPRQVGDSFTMNEWILVDDAKTVYRSRHMRQAGRMLPVVFTQRFMPSPPPQATKVALVLSADGGDSQPLARVEVPLW